MKRTFSLTLIAFTVWAMKRLMRWDNIEPETRHETNATRPR